MLFKASAKKSISCSSTPEGVPRSSQKRLVGPMRVFSKRLSNPHDALPCAAAFFPVGPSPNHLLRGEVIIKVGSWPVDQLPCRKNSVMIRCPNVDVEEVLPPLLPRAGWRLLWFREFEPDAPLAEQWPGRPSPLLEVRWPSRAPGRPFLLLEHGHEPRPPLFL